MTEPTVYRKKLSDKVREYIRRQIERGVLRSGDRIRESELCQTLGLSRTPIREALIQLTTEGVVEALPRRLIRVKKHSLKELRDLSTIISTLEAGTHKVIREHFNYERNVSLREHPKKTS